MQMFSCIQNFFAQPLKSYLSVPKLIDLLGQSNLGISSISEATKNFVLSYTALIESYTKVC